MSKKIIQDNSFSPYYITNIPLEDYFPTCILPNCELKDEHSHILPHQLEIMDFGINDDYIENKCFLTTQGGVGSAKTVAFAARLVREMIEVPGNLGISIRQDFGELYKSSWFAIKNCIKKLIRLNHLPPISYLSKDVGIKTVYERKKQGDYSIINFHNGSILYAGQGKDWRQGLGSEYGVFWCDDAMELNELLFVGDENSAGLVSRLRYPSARFSRDKDGKVINRLIGLNSTNPPPYGHWLHTLFGKEPGIHTIGNDVSKVMRVETTDNPFVGGDYASGLIAIQSKMGRDIKTVERIIFGKSTPAYGGIPVFNGFQHTRHVGKFKYDKDFPLVEGWDFGYLHPAVTFSMLFKCDAGSNHYITLNELVHLRNVNVWEIYREEQKIICDCFSDATIILRGGDKAGDRASSSNKDKRSDMRILMSDYGLSFRSKWMNLDNSLEYMRGLLSPDGRKVTKPCPCGMEYIQIDNSCEILIGALEGGYKYNKKRDGTIQDKPFEDRLFADVACAWRYGAENFMKYGNSYVNTILPPNPYTRANNNNSWDWMNLTDAEFAKLLTN